MTNRIVLIDDDGVELFSGFSVSSPPPAAEPVRKAEAGKSLADLAEEVLNALDSADDDDGCPPTLRSIAPPPASVVAEDESGVFIRAAESRSRIPLGPETSKKLVDERVA